MSAVIFANTLIQAKKAVLRIKNESYEIGEKAYSSSSILMACSSWIDIDGVPLKSVTFPVT